MPQHLPSRVLAHRLPHQTLPAASGVSVSVRFSYWQTRKLTSRGQVTKLARSYGRWSQSQIPDSILGRPLCSSSLTTSRIMISRFPRRSLVPLTHARAKQVLYEFNRPCAYLHQVSYCVEQLPCPRGFVMCPTSFGYYHFTSSWLYEISSLWCSKLVVWPFDWGCDPVIVKSHTPNGVVDPDDVGQARMSEENLTGRHVECAWLSLFGGSVLIPTVSWSHSQITWGCSAIQ